MNRTLISDSPTGNRFGAKVGAFIIRENRLVPFKVVFCRAEVMVPPLLFTGVGTFVRNFEQIFENNFFYFFICVSLPHVDSYAYTVTAV